MTHRVGSPAVCISLSAVNYLISSPFYSQKNCKLYYKVSLLRIVRVWKSQEYNCILNIKMYSLRSEIPFWDMFKYCQGIAHFERKFVANFIDSLITTWVIRYKDRNRTLNILTLQCVSETLLKNLQNLILLK